MGVGVYLDKITAGGIGIQRRKPKKTNDSKNSERINKIILFL
jgi:hypothetical protein